MVAACWINRVFCACTPFRGLLESATVGSSMVVFYLILLQPSSSWVTWLQRPMLHDERRVRSESTGSTRNIHLLWSAMKITMATTGTGAPSAGVPVLAHLVHVQSRVMWTKSICLWGIWRAIRGMPHLKDWSSWPLCGCFPQGSWLCRSSAVCFIFIEWLIHSSFQSSRRSEHCDVTVTS